MSYRRCDNCRTWKYCRGYDWFQPFEIERNFCKLQVLFLIGIVETLEIGEYPPDPAPTGYVGGNTGGFRSGARFQRPADLYSELTSRISRTGKDGDTLLHEVRHLGATLHNLSQAARNALGYCCGEKRKRQKYGIWLSRRKYRPAKKV